MLFAFGFLGLFSIEGLSGVCFSHPGEWISTSQNKAPRRQY
jgi:hypothetical protein